MVDAIIVSANLKGLTIEQNKLRTGRLEYYIRLIGCEDYYKAKGVYCGQVEESFVVLGLTSYQAQKLLDFAFNNLEQACVLVEANGQVRLIYEDGHEEVIGTSLVALDKPVDPDNATQLPDGRYLAAI